MNSHINYNGFINFINILYKKLEKKFIFYDTKKNSAVLVQIKFCEYL